MSIRGKMLVNLALRDKEQITASNAVLLDPYRFVETPQHTPKITDHLHSCDNDEYPITSNHYASNSHGISGALEYIPTSESKYTKESFESLAVPPKISSLYLDLTSELKKDTLEPSADDSPNKTTSSSDSESTEYIPESTSDSESTSSNSETTEHIPRAAINLSDVENIPRKQTEQQKNNIDNRIVRFGEIMRKAASEDIEHYSNSRPWTKKNSCPYCFQEITHFSRHLQRNHKEEGAVKEFLTLPPKDTKRKLILNLIRRQGNFVYLNHSNIVKPVRRPRNVDQESACPSQENEKYVTCPDCFGFFKRNFLRRHRKNCKVKEKSGARDNHLSEAQMFKICNGPFSDFYNSLRLKNEVFTIMRADNISQIAMKDALICSYAESLLKKHKRTQIRTTISNKMRELGRLLINLKDITSTEHLFDALKPECFDNIVCATKIISGYDGRNKTYKAASLALHMGTTLKQVCDIATKMVIKNSPLFPCDDKEMSLKNIKRFKHLVINHWNSEVSSLALKDLNEKHWEKPKLFPLTSSVIKFQQYLMVNGKEAYNKLLKRENLNQEFRRLTEIVLSLTVLLNRKRIGEVQYLKVNTYNGELSFNTQQELLQTLSDSERILTQNFKRVVTGGKGSKPVAILFPKEIQNFIKTLLSVRDMCVPKTNEYLFANPKTDNRWLNGYSTLQKLAKGSGVEDTRLFTSTRLRKQIATVLQVINITDSEIEQFAAFMGHTKKTHETYYRLPQDIYQTAKVSKLLLAISKGKITEYKGKSLDEIELSDNAETGDSDNDQDSPDREQNKSQKLQEIQPSTSKVDKTSTKIKLKLRKANKVQEVAVSDDSEPSISKKDKNETSRFLGEGVSFKAKLIGILEVSEARGDRMCQEALSDLKTAIRAAGEHKQRITINVAIDGLRLRDEKTGDSLYHHPVHKISFIAQDMTDSRAFGYIFGSPDTGHRFFGIKTDKAASQVVIAMRDLFQVVFALKKKEVEIAKQHLDKNRFGTSLFSETTLSGSKVLDLTTEANKISSCDSKINTTNTDFSTPAVADLVDLEFELNSLQQGLHQMERITPSESARCKDDPFGDSFTPFPKPILPPPPSSGKERTSRVSESSSLFSPKTPQTGKNDDTSTLDSSSFFFTPKNNLSHNFNVLHNKSNNSDWFAPSANNSFFEDQPLTSEQTKPQCQDHHEKKKQEILSHFDVFTDLDPLGTGKIKPYVDKKHFFQELKNPPKKILNDLVVESQSEATGKNSTSPIFPATFDLSTSLSTTTTTTTTIITNTMNNNNSISSVSVGNNMLTSADVSKTNNTSTCLNLFAVDPFGEDPFVRNDPFVETDFAKQDPFDSELSIFNRDQQKDKVTDYMEQFKLFTKSPADSSKIMSCLEKHMSLDSVLPRYNATRFNKENSFNVHFNQTENGKSDHLSQLHENHSLDLSSESECAPEPPPRPTSNISQTIPPPLPPKKQLGETCVKPPPRPPHSDFDSRYDYIETYETAPNSLELAGTEVEESPPLPVPARKTKLDNEFGRAMNKLKISAVDEDYLTPVSIPNAKEGLVLLPPPQKSNRKNNITPNNLVQVTVSSYLDTKPNIVSNTPTGEKNVLDDGFDITLSQLTISGLNDLAMKLDISTAQLSNMTVAQFSTYLSNFIRNKSSDTSTESGSAKSKNNVIFPADFANFSNFNIKTGDTYDRYAVFRELFEEEIKQAGFNSEAKNKNNPESIEEINSISHINDMVANNESNDENTTLVDKYAALREMVAIEKNDTGKSIDEQNNLDENTGNEDRNDLSEKRLHEKNVEVENKTNIINAEHVDNKLITYNVSMDITNDTVATVQLPTEDPIISEIIDNRPTSGSLSDIVSGSSPEIDNTGSNSEVAKKINDTTGESWAIFDQLNSTGELSRDKQNIQSEEGVSPWSSDSKEFGNDGSPPDSDLRNDSGSGGDQRWSQRKRDTDGGGWWDTSAEPEVQYYPATSANRRSTDSYDDECYECYEKPRRRRQCWTTSGGQISVEVGGHSSSSRDVSPWEEEPSSKEDYRDSRQTWTSKHTSGRQYSSERHRDKRNNDSWDEEDDYEYEEEHCNRFYWHGAERHSDGNREHNHWSSDWEDDTRQHVGRRRRNVDSREHWCCPDWNGREIDETVGRYNGRRSDIPLSSKRRDRDRYYSRDSQDSPWEDEYSNDAEESGGSGLTFHYSTARRSWKRPNSASEMDRKIGEMKPRQGLYHLGTGGSDGERDKRYKSGRRSKSRESPFLDIFYNRHKSDAVTLRTRSKYHHQKMGHFESDYLPQEMIPIKKGCDVAKVLNQDHSTGKKSSAAGHRKKTKEGQKTEEFGRKCLPPATKSPESPFENDFVTTQTENPCGTVKIGKRFSFEKEFETSEADSPTINSRSSKIIGVYSKVPPKLGSKSTSSKSFQFTHRSPFEDDFSPTEKSDTLNSPIVAATKEDQRSTLHKNEHESFGKFRSRGKEVSKKVLKSRISDSVDNLKKSESVNIFARENDPFDDEFFSCTNIGEEMSIEICNNGGSKSKMSPRTDSKWTEQFQNFDSK